MFCSLYVDVSCYVEGQSQAYNGSTAVDRLGDACVDWKLYEAGSSNRNTPFVIDANFPETTVVEASNYCRAPNGATRPWCYVDDDNGWSYCNVPVCTGRVNINIVRFLSDDRSYVFLILMWFGRAIIFIYIKS